MRSKVCLLGILLLAGCVEQDPPPANSPVLDAPQVSVGQAWQEIERRSLYTPSLEAMDQGDVLSHFEQITNPTGQSSLGLSFESEDDFLMTVSGQRFTELERLVPMIDKPSDAPRWHIYGAWVNAVARSVDHQASFYPPNRQDDISKMITASEEGVGVDLSTPPDGGVFILSVSPQGPAAKAGVKPGDKLVAVKEKGEWVDLSASNAYEAQSLLRGPTGTKITMKVNSSGMTRTIDIVRDKWFLDDMRVKSGRVGSFPVISIPGFYVDADQHARWDISTHQDVSLELSKIRDPGGFILDLRGNPGGVLEEAKEVASLVGLSGVAWSIKTMDISTDAVIAENESLPPLAVWIDGATGSSAEILAGALQSRGVKVVGLPSHGKTTLQLMLPLDQPSFKRNGQSKTGNLLLTTAKVAWSDSDMGRVIPDCIVEDVESMPVHEQYELTTERCISPEGGK